MTPWIKRTPQHVYVFAQLLQSSLLRQLGDSTFVSWTFWNWTCLAFENLGEYAKLFTPQQLDITRNNGTESYVI